MDTTPSAQLPLDLTQEEIHRLRRIAIQEGIKLGYVPDQMTLEVMNIKGTYVAYLVPKKQGALGGDLTILLRRDGGIICPFEGM